MSKSPQLQGHSVFSFTDKGLINNTQLIPTVESLITMPRDKIKAVDVAFFSFPCINETVLRHGTNAQYDDTKSGMLAPGGGDNSTILPTFRSAVDPRARGRRRTPMTYYGRRPAIINKYFYGRGQPYGCFWP